MATDPKSQVLVVDDDVAVGKVLAALLVQVGHGATFIERGELALAELERRPYDLVLTDVRMPGMGGMELLEQVGEKYPGLPVVLLTAHGTVSMAVEAMKAGAWDFLQKPFDREEIVFVVNKALAATRAEREAPPRATSAGTAALEALIGGSPAMQEVRALIKRAAATTATVLVRGENGTGKELVAQALHVLSPRAKGPFIKLNCAAVPEPLFESDLFGHEKGAFTGAIQRKPGRVELAEGGTLFLDEIGDVKLEAQVKLLRLVQEKEYDRVGGTQTLKADVRFITATNQPLEELVKTGRFREDLLYRLNVVPLVLPPLRARRSDVPMLAKHFVEQLGKQHQRPASLAPDAVVLLEAQPWPGNVRQLQNLLERLVVLNDADLISGEDVRRELARDGGQPVAPSPGVPVPVAGEAPPTLDAQRKGVEREAVKQALDKAHGNRTLAARMLNISRRTLYNKLEALGLVEGQP